MTSGHGIPVQHCGTMMHMINNSTQISMEYIFDVFHYISGCTWQQFYVEYVMATVASAQSRTTYWAVVTGRFIGDRQNIGDIGGTAAAARAAPLFTAVGLVSAMATAIASAPASPDQQSLIATPMAVPPPIGSTPVPESQPQPPALFFLFCFFCWVTGELSTLRQQMKVPNEPGLSPQPPAQQPARPSSINNVDCDPEQLKAGLMMSYLPKVQIQLDLIPADMLDYTFPPGFLQNP